MQRRGFLALVGATTILVAGAVVAIARGDRAVTQVPVGEPALPTLRAKLGELAWVRVSHGAVVANFAQIGGKWALIEKGNYPADQGKIGRLLLALADLTLVEAKTQRAELFGRLAVEDPKLGHSTLVALQDRGGATVAELIVGNRRHDRLGGGNDGVYVRRPGSDQAWLARGTLDIPETLVGWLDRRIIDVPAARIASVKLSDPGGGTLILKRDAPDGAFAIENLPDDAKVKKPEALAQPAGALAELDFDDLRPAADLPVPDQGVASATFTTFDGLSVELFLFERNGTDWAAFDVSGSGGAETEAKAIADRLSHWSYAIPAATAKLLRTKLADLVEPAKGS